MQVLNLVLCPILNLEIITSSFYAFHKTVLFSLLILQYYNTTYLWYYFPIFVAIFLLFSCESLILSHFFPEVP